MRAEIEPVGELPGGEIARPGIDDGAERVAGEGAGAGGGQGHARHPRDPGVDVRHVLATTAVPAAFGVSSAPVQWPHCRNWHELQRPPAGKRLVEGTVPDVTMAIFEAWVGSPPS